MKRLLVLPTLLCYAYFVPRGIDWNADSHLALTRALVEQHTAVIDAYARGLGDRSLYHGHYYTDKAPGLSLLAIPGYLLLKLALGPVFFGKLFFIVRYLITIIVVGLPSAVAVAVLQRRLRRFVGLRQSLVAALAWALATPAFPFSTLLFSHQVGAVLLLAAFLMLYLPAEPAASLPHPASRRLLVAGVLCGISVACEYPTALLALVLLGGQVVTAGARGDWPSGLRQAIPLAGGALLGVAPALIYNALVYGGPLSQGYAHLGGQQQFITGMGEGFMGITHPSLDALWGITFSPYRGLFFLCPWLLLALPGLLMMGRAGAAHLQVAEGAGGGSADGLRAAAIVCAVAVVVYALFNASYAFWDGGYSVGPRHVVPALPFLIIPVAFALCQPALWLLALPLIAVSLVTMMVSMSTAPLFTPTLGNPIYGWAWPQLLAGHVGNNWGFFLGLRGSASLLPLLVIETLLGLLVWRRARAMQAMPGSQVIQR